MTDGVTLDQTETYNDDFDSDEGTLMGKPILLTEDGSFSNVRKINKMYRSDERNVKEKN